MSTSVNQQSMAWEFGGDSHSNYMLELSECCIGGGKQRTCSTGMLSESLRRRYLFNTAKIWLLRI